MIKVWDKSKIDVYFDDVEQEKIVRQGFNNLVNEVSEVEITAFVQALDSLHELPTEYAVVSDSYRYTI